MRSVNVCVGESEMRSVNVCVCGGGGGEGVVMRSVNVCVCVGE